MHIVAIYMHTKKEIKCREFGETLNVFKIYYLCPIFKVINITKWNLNGPNMIMDLSLNRLLELVTCIFGEKLF